jgi:hypothetical protein
MIATLLTDDLVSWGIESRPVALGRDAHDEMVEWYPAGSTLLVTGGSGSGKSTLVAASSSVWV